MSYQNAHSCISCGKPISLSKAVKVPVSGNLFLLFCSDCATKLSDTLEPEKPQQQAMLLNKAEQAEQAIEELKRLIAGNPSPEVKQRIEQEYRNRNLQ